MGVSGMISCDRLLPGRQVPVIFWIAHGREADHTAAAVGKRSVRPHGG